MSRRRRFRRNPDVRLRELERRWKETGDPQAGAAYLAERVRAGEVSPAGIEVLACLRDPAAMLVTQCPIQTREPWADEGIVAANGPVYAVLVGLAVAEVVQPLILVPPLRTQDPSAVAGSILLGVRAWLDGKRRGCYRYWGHVLRGSRVLESPGADLWELPEEWVPREGWPPDETWYSEIANVHRPLTDACFWPGAREQLEDRFEGLMEFSVDASGGPGPYPYMMYTFAKLMQLVAQADVAPRSVFDSDFANALWHLVSDALNACSLSYGIRVRRRWLSTEHPEGPRPPQGARAPGFEDRIVNLSPYGLEYATAMRQHVLERVRPWVLAGSPDVWTVL